MENLENQQANPAAETLKPKPKTYFIAAVITAVILSFIFGGLGGYFGVFLANKKSGWANNFGITGGLSNNQKISLSEDSAIIDAVKKASPAVVSIVISQDLSKVPGYGVNPFNNDPFFNFFYNNGGQSQDPQSGTPDVQEIGAGSGFFISADGLIVTNKHVVDNQQASYTVLTSDGKKYDAKVLSRDPVNDLAIVKIDIKGAHFLELANSENLQVGQRVIAIGNSLGQYQNTVTSGIISGIGRKITAGSETGSEQLSNVIQTDAAINPGNSGGPLLDITGNVVGINTAIDQQGQLVGFAIPSNEVSKAVTSFNKNGKITRAFLGVHYFIITPNIASGQKLPRDFGALIVRGNSSSDSAVIPGSPADKAGLVENDIILQVNGINIDENNTLSDILAKYNPGDMVTLKIFDKGNEKDVKVTLGEA